MIRDYESELYDRLTTYVAVRVPNISFASVEISGDKSLPFLSIEMIDCPVDMKTFDGSEFACAPKIKTVAYTKNNDKVLAKQILVYVDEFMASLGFIRTLGPSRYPSDNETIMAMYLLYDGNIIDKRGYVHKR